MTAAAMTGPDPEQPGQAGPGRLDGGGELRPGLADPGVDAAQGIDEGHGELAAGCGHRVRRCDRSEDLCGLACGDRLADAPRNQLAQHGMQPADDLGTAAAQVPVALGPDLQHRRVIIGPDLPDAGRAQRGDRHRPGIIGVVLVHIPGSQQPDPRAELGRHIQHPLTRALQLLGQQMPRAAGALDRPGPLRPGRGPHQQPLRLGSAGGYPQLTQRLLGRADRHRGVRGLVRIDPDHHCRHGKLLPYRRARTVASTPNSRTFVALAPLLSHATARPRQAGTSFGSQAQQGGRRFESRASRDLSTLRPRLTSIPARPAPSTESLNWADQACQGRRGIPDGA